MNRNHALDWIVGQELDPQTMPAVTRTTLALFAGASGDHNPIHIDIDVAKAAGAPDVFAHGMLGMAYLARALTHWAPQQQLCELSVRFSAITHVGDTLRCKALVDDISGDGSNRHAHLNLTVINSSDEIKLIGHALVRMA